MQTKAKKLFLSGLDSIRFNWKNKQINYFTGMSEIHDISLNFIF